RHGVRAVDEGEEDVAIGRPAQVEDHGALVPVDAREVATVVAALAVGGMGRHGPGHVALGRPDLHHVGTEVGEQQGAEGPGERLRQVEEADVRKRSRAWGDYRGVASPRAQWVRRLWRTSRSPSQTIVP